MSTEDGYGGIVPNPSGISVLTGQRSSQSVSTYLDLQWYMDRRQEKGGQRVVVNEDLGCSCGQVGDGLCLASGRSRRRESFPSGNHGTRGSLVANTLVRESLVERQRMRSEEAGLTQRAP